MSEIDELFWLIAFIAGCVVLLVIVLANIGANRFFKWWEKKGAEMQREAEIKKRMGRK
jgi:hypothetical protein